MEEQHIDEPVKPGQYLAYEREKKGFTIEDVASKLYLSPHIIRALEEDAYDRLPEPVYVRGYIRLYSRLLHIDPVPVLDMYAVNLPQEDDYLLEDLALNSTVDERQQRLIMFWGSIAIVSIFLILIIGWWHEKQSPNVIVDKPMVPQDISVEQPHIMDSNISDSPVKQKGIPADAEVENVPKEPISPVSEQEVTQSESDMEAEQTEPADPSVLNPIEIKIKKAFREGDVLYETVSSSARRDDMDTELSSEQINRVGDTQQLITLVVTTNSDSWARVRDGSGEIIIHRILPSNYNKIFMVNLPLKFELGKADGVNIMLDGKDYDFSPYIRSSRAATFEVTKLP